MRMAIAGFSLLLPFSGALIAQDAPGTERDIRIAYTSDPDTLKPGDAGTLLISFIPRKGFHVNAVPPMSVKFDSLSPAELRDSLNIPQDTSTGYLNTAESVRQPFALKKDLKPGKAEIPGTLIYYYCSDTEGWCRREKESFTIPVVLK